MMRSLRRLRRLTPPVLSVIALALLGGGTARAQMPGAPPPGVTVAKPVVREIVEQDQYTGRFDPIEFVEVRARVGAADEVLHLAAGHGHAPAAAYAEPGADRHDRTHADARHPPAHRVRRPQDEVLQHAGIVGGRLGRRGGGRGC